MRWLKSAHRFLAFRQGSSIGSGSLIEAAAVGDLHRLESLLAAGENLEARDSEGDTSLTIAAARGHVSAVKLLLEKGSDISVKCNAGNTALHSAAIKGHLNVVEILLAKGADKDAQNKRGSTSLRLAASAGFEDVFLALLQNGADPDRADNDGNTPLMAAAYRDGLTAICALLNAGVDPNVENRGGQTSLMFAVNRGALRSVTKLLDAGAKVENSGAELVALAISAPQNSDLVALKVIEAGGKPSGLFKGATALLTAISSNRPVIVEALLAAGANPNEIGRPETQMVTPLIAAAMSGDIQCTESLLKYGADCNQAAGELTPIAAAMIGGHDEIMRLLLAASATFTKASVVLTDSDDGGGAEIEGDLASLIAREWENVRVGGTSTPRISQERIPPLMNFALHWLMNEANEVARVVISNHIGVPRRRDEEKRAKKRCVEEIARLLIRGTDFYEDDDESIAMAEFVLSRSRYRQLVELGRQSTGVSLASPGDGLGYEEACRNELITHGYTVHKTPPTGDQGADLLANKDGITYAIQCKNYAGSVGNSAVQQAISAKQYYRTDNAVVVSDGQFTKSARELAARAAVVLCKRDGIRHIDVVCRTIA